MQPGFMCLEAGLIRAKNSINVAIKNLVDFGISVILFWAIGYGLMFGNTHHGWVGTTGFFLPLETNPQQASFFIFQVMFCSTATTIISGAVAERLKFSAYLWITCITSGIIYPVFGHWAWNGFNHPLHMGWLRQLGFVDFSGSTVVHSVGGWVALATLLVLGPRQGRFAKDGTPQPMTANNLALSVLGAFLIWLGWLGFNGGNTLVFSDRVPGIIGHTVMAGATGMITGLMGSWWLLGVPHVPLMINGALGGLVGITASCHVITTGQAIVVGAISAVIVLGLDRLLERLRIDDAVGAVAVHTGAGIWGTIALALFGNLEQLGLGLTRWQQLQVQLLGIGLAFMWGFVLPWLLLRTLNRYFPLRVSIEQEQSGLNASEHNIKEEVTTLFEVMEQQAKSQDLGLRVPVEPFTEVGRIAHRYNQVMDALEEAISRTEAVVNTAADAIFTFQDVDLKIISANPSASHIFGYKSADLCGLTLSELLSPGDAKRLLQASRSTLEMEDGSGLNASDLGDRPGNPALMQAASYPYQEVQGQQALGTLVPLEAHLTKATVGDRSFYMGTFRNISDRKEAESQLKSLVSQLQQTSLALQEKNTQLEKTMVELQRTQAKLIQQEKMASLEKMVGGIAHEFNNPVNFIFGNLVYLQQYAQDLLYLLRLYQQRYPEPGSEITAAIEEIDLVFVEDDLPKILASIQQGSVRIRDIVQSLRIFSCLDEATLKRVDLHASLDSTLLMLQSRLRGSGGFPSITLMKNYQPVPLVECYAKELNQVCLHILSNAIDALYETMTFRSPKSHEFHPQIEVSIQPLKPGFVRISISNNGPEIPSDIRTKMFDPFFTTKPVGKGMGLGLAESYQVVVERHGGYLDFHTSEQGTTFMIDIPVEQAAYLQSPPRLNLPLPQETVSPPPNPLPTP